jgi:hypothetical protein
MTETLTKPDLDPVAQRQAIERAIAAAAIDGILAEGHEIDVYDGEETTLRRSRDKAAILAAMFTTDEDRLYVRHRYGTRYFGWVQFIYGNEGWDVIQDNTTNLDRDLAAASALAVEFEDAVCGGNPLVTSPAVATALGYAEFNTNPHLCVDVPDGYFTITARTSEGKRITFAFLASRENGPPQFVDVMFHDSGATRSNGQQEIPVFDMLAFNGPSGFLLDTRTNGKPKPSIACILLDKVEG